MMWEQWRAEIDRSLRDAEAARELWDDREFRADLRSGSEEALRRFRLFAERPIVTPRRVRSASWWERAFGKFLPQQAPAVQPSARSSIR